MAFTYRWDDVIGIVKDLAKGVNFGGKDVMYCDLVDNVMYNYRPWFWKMTTVATGTIPLIDGQQDYSVPGFHGRITKLSLARTDVTPWTFRELDILEDLPQDLVKKSPYVIRAASLQAGVGQIRLDSAVQIPTGTSWEIDGTFKSSHDRVTATTQKLWFPDNHVQVAAEGLLYWNYRRADDSRAGTAQRQEDGKTVFSGQLAVFMNALNDMAKEQDDQGTTSLFPEDTLGRGRDQWMGPNIFGVY